jgi:hypothetical protein
MFEQKWPEVFIFNSTACFIYLVFYLSYSNKCIISYLMIYAHLLVLLFNLP